MTSTGRSGRLRRSREARLYTDNGKENGNYYNGAILGLYRDNGKENGNYYSGFRV